MLPDPGTHASLYLLLFGLIVAAMIARRVPLLRILLTLATWAVLAGLIVVLVGQRERFDPYFARALSVLKLDDQTVVGGEVRIRMAPDGHFWARVKVDGVARRMLIDSGATVTALSVGTAGAAGLEVRDELFPILLRTANGTIQAKTATVADLRLGAISARDLPVVVSPAFGNADILGMNFLSKLKSWRVEDGTLILVPHHPQREETGD